MADKPVPVRQVASTVTKIEADGIETHEPMAWSVLPPTKDACQICAARHEADAPHNAQSIYYQMIFVNQIGRAVTWADAVAHCSEPVRTAWECELRRMGHWSEPPAGEKPIKHHGVEDGTIAKPIEDAFRQAINDD